MDEKQLIQSLKKSKSEDDRKKCIPLLQQYLEKNPQDAEAWYDLAGCFDFIGAEKEAEPCYRKCYQIGWQNLPVAQQPSFFVGYGSTLRNNFKYEESVSVLQKAVEAFPDYPALKVFLAFSLYSQKEDRAAAELLFSACLGSAAKGFDGYEKAIHWYVENIKTHPESRS